MAAYSCIQYFSKKYFCSQVKDLRVFSGIQPTGSMHLGNYFGAIRNWIDLQKSVKFTYTIYSIVDLHSITVPQKPDELNGHIKLMTATLLACGIDPNVSILFQQSHVPQHAELAWILGTLSTMAKLFHLPQYKEKSAKFKDTPFGLFAYPILQTADILLYKATHVPVGADQTHQIELVQHLTRVFNRKFGFFFPVPKSLVPDDLSCRIKSLRDPLSKMAKSDPDPKSRINLLDTPDEIVLKIKKAVTDTKSELTFDPANRPGVSNLLTIHSKLADKSIEEIVKESAGLDTGRYKLSLADVVVESLKPIREKTMDYLKNPDYLLNILKCGSDRAKAIAEPNIIHVHKLVGFK